MMNSMRFCGCYPIKRCQGGSMYMAYLDKNNSKICRPTLKKPASHFIHVLENINLMGSVDEVIILDALIPAREYTYLQLALTYLTSKTQKECLTKITNILLKMHQHTRRGIPLIGVSKHHWITKNGIVTRTFIQPHTLYAVVMTVLDN